MPPTGHKQRKAQWRGCDSARVQRGRTGWRVRVVSYVGTADAKVQRPVMGRLAGDGLFLLQSSVCVVPLVPGWRGECLPTLAFRRLVPLVCLSSPLGPQDFGRLVGRQRRVGCAVGGHGGWVLGGQTDRLPLRCCTEAGPGTVMEATCADDKADSSTASAFYIIYCKIR